MSEINTRKKMPAPEPKVIRRGEILLLTAAGLILAALIFWMVFGTIRTSFTAQGVLTTGTDSRMIHYPMDGVVTEILVENNQFVKKADPLLQIYPRQPGETTSLEEMKRAAVSVPAPMSGYVTEVSVQPWTSVNLSTTLARMTESDDPVIDCALTFLPLQDAERIGPGTRVSIQLQAPSGLSTVIPGVVETVTELPVSDYMILTSVGLEAAARSFERSGQDLFGVLVRMDPEENGRHWICNEICYITFYSAEVHPIEILIGRQAPEGQK